MKSLYLAGALSLLSITLLSFDQHDSSTINLGPSKAVKGYYSIGDNAKKLMSIPFRSADTFVTPEVKKGYYSIESNNKSLPKKAVWNKPKPRPVITKGYYSIGAGTEKK